MCNTLPVSLTFNKVYKENKQTVSRYISNKIRNKEIAEELVDDVFIKVSQHLERFDGSLSALSTWIYNITKNTLIDHFRKTLNTDGIPKFNSLSIDTNINDNEQTSIVQHLEIITPDNNPLQQLISNETTDRAIVAIKSLNKLEKKLMTLYASKSKTYEEIANEMDMPLGTVKGTIHRARITLKEKLVLEYQTHKQVYI